MESIENDPKKPEETLREEEITFSIEEYCELNKRFQELRVTDPSM